MTVRLSAIVLVLAGIAVYANGASGVFLFDDDTHITNNANLHDAFDHPTYILTHQRPVATLTLAFNYAIAQKSDDGAIDPFGFHVVNIAIHIMSGLTLFGLARRTLMAARARGKALLEVSGGVTLDRVADIARAGIDVISVGALTHSAPAADIAYVDGGKIAVDSPVEGEIAAGERVRYVLVTDANVTVDISLTDAEGALDTYLRIYDENDAVITENDDIRLGEQINSLVTGLQVTAGQPVIIEVATYNDVLDGAYVLEVSTAG